MKSLYSLLVLLSFWGLNGFAQDYSKSKFITVRGSVESVSGEPLTSATIRVPNTTFGTATDKNGNFSLEVPVSCKITVSSVGYIDEEIACNNNNYLLVFLNKRKRIDSAVITSASIIDVNPQLEKERFNYYKDNNRIFTKVEVLSQFPGGEKKFKEYIIKNLVYPDSSLMAGVEGSLILKFTVGNNGYLKNIRIIRGLDRFCDSVALVVFRNSPQWLPAIQNGRQVEEDIDYVIRFSRNGSSESKIETQKSKIEPKVDIAPKEEIINSISKNYSKVVKSSKEFQYASQLVNRITDTSILNLYFDSVIYRKFRPLGLKERTKYDKSKAMFYAEGLSEFRRILSNYFASSYTINEIKYLHKMYAGEIGRSIALKQIASSSEMEYFYLESFMKSVTK
ncbi:TonB family protein [Lacibacter cauensis]|uniref:TonB family protein n=1 Tax=Lacibacter cauensis TaxID=510947 RepID=A0A562SPG0_9BACT|nr:energy transducer TonB [Lacibacter cauensis]TWI83132.1 TonB family protein [Lacibacter cauensis]